MRSWTVGVGQATAVALSLLFAHAALADTKQECADAYDNTQVLRDAGNIEAALREAAVCTRDACARFIRDDCARWKTDLEALEASIVLEILDASGAPVTDGKVTLDGTPWLDRLDGKTHVLSKGPHILEITVKGEAPKKESIVVREGEKSRKVSITLGAEPPATGAPQPPGAGMSVGPWILGGVGVAALVAGAVTGGLTVADHGVATDECNDATRRCTQAGKDAADRGRLLGPATTGLLVGGSALIAGGVIWFVVAGRSKEPEATSFFVTPAVSIREYGAVVGGSW